MKSMKKIPEMLEIPENVLDVSDQSLEGWHKWAKTLFAKDKEVGLTTKDDSVRNVNPLFIPEAGREILKLMSYLPLWTGIMLSAFKIDLSSTRSSAAIEGIFSKLKTKFSINYHLDVINLFTYLMNI